jgi:GR25 family glycosyltransferase involved in LPS biosynthesis
MQKLIEYFGGAYLINLPERKDRLRLAQRVLARANCVAGGGLQIYAAKKFIDRAGFPDPGARGCFNSHAECLRLAQREGGRHVLLLEDDIALSSSLSRLAPSILSQLRSERWDLVYFGHERTGEIENANYRTVDVRLAPIKSEAEMRTTHFYGVNNRILSRLIAHLDRVAAGSEGDQEFGPMPIDGALNIFRRKNRDIKTLIANPKLGWQRPSRSDITPRSFDNLRAFHSFTERLRELKYVVNRWRS